MNTHSQPITVEALAEQLMRQGQLLEQLAALQNNQMEMVDETPANTDVTLQLTILHNLPTRPSYTWQPSELLEQYIPAIKCNIFDSTLVDDDKRNIIDRYPAVEGMR